MRAFTLVDFLVSVLIFMVISAGVYAVCTVGNSAYLTDIGLMRLQQEARQAMRSMILDLRSASNIVPAVVDANSDTITFNNFSGSNIIYYRDLGDVNGDGITDQLIRQHGTPRVIANDITRLKFNYASHIVTIDVTAGRIVRQRPLSYSLRNQVRVRNEK